LSWAYFLENLLEGAIERVFLPEAGAMRYHFSPSALPGYLGRFNNSRKQRKGKCKNLKKQKGQRSQKFNIAQLSDWNLIHAPSKNKADLL
jgi:hypothetical protein